MFLPIELLNWKMDGHFESRKWKREALHLRVLCVTVFTVLMCFKLEDYSLEWWKVCLPLLLTEGLTLIQVWLLAHFRHRGGGLSFVTVLNQKSPSFPFPMVCGFWVQRNTLHNEGGVSMTNVV